MDQELINKNIWLEKMIIFNDYPFSFANMKHLTCTEAQLTIMKQIMLHRYDSEP